MQIFKNQPSIFGRALGNDDKVCAAFLQIATFAKFVKVVSA